MRIVFAILVLTCCAGLSEATLKHLKAQLILSPLTQPAARYKYVVPPVILPDPVLAVHSSPVSTFSSHTSTYSTVPYLAVSKSPTYSRPVVYRSTVAVPVPIYEEPSVIHYEEPLGVPLEASAFDIEGHYSNYGYVWDK